MDWDDKLPNLEFRAPRRIHLGQWSKHPRVHNTNTTRHDTIWPEEWPRLSKMQKQELSNWDDEKTRLQDSRGKRDFLRIRPKTHTTTGERISNAREKLETCVVPSVPCLPEEECSRKPAVMPIFQRTRKPEATIMSKKLRTCGKTSSERYGPCRRRKDVCLKSSTVHTPITLKEDEEGRVICSFHIPHGPLPSQTLRVCETSSKSLRESVLWWDNVKDENGNKAVWGKAHHLLKWRQQNCWIQCPYFQACQEKPTTRYRHYTHAHISDRSQICRDYWKRITHKHGSVKQPPSRRPNPWDALEKTVVHLDWNPFDRLWAGLLWERKSEEVHSKDTWESVPTWSCLHVCRKIATVLVRFM